MSAGRVRIVTSEFTILEGLVGALRRGDLVLANEYRGIREDASFRVVAVDIPIIERAAELRAQGPALRTPDAIHIATADLAGCDAFVTNDKSLRKVGLTNVIVLDDLL